MRRYLLIGGNKKTLKTSFRDKCPYLRDLYKKEREILQNIGIKKAEIISERILKKENFQRDYSFFAHNKPEMIEEKRFPQINVSSLLKFSIISPEEKYLVNKPEKNDEFVKIYKSNSISFPKTIEKYKNKRISKKKKIKSKSYLNLPSIY